jgi:hypothetical protein
VDVDERHRSGERGDPIGDSVLDALRALVAVADEGRVRLRQNGPPGVETDGHQRAGATRPAIRRVSTPSATAARRNRNMPATASLAGRASDEQS